jgi:recombination protein RecR
MSDALSQLVKKLSRLPGIGEKTATRLAFHILSAPEVYARELAEAILDVKRKLGECKLCFKLCEGDLCEICSDPKRDPDQICVVATLQDLAALERMGTYRGRYHVLHGVLAPLEGVGPDDLRIQPLLERLQKGGVKELILATSPNVEGDATALYLAKLVKPLGVRVTRISSGVPTGGELEYTDGVTLGRALDLRREM